MASSQNLPVHFVLVPLMSPGHLLPMVDIAKLLAQRGAISSIVTTPLNTIRFKSIIDQSVNNSGLSIRIIEFDFPAVASGLPEGCENMDLLPSRNLIKNFFLASSKLQGPFEEQFDKLQPRPHCIISGKNLAWTVETARKFEIPRLFFDGMGCFAFSCVHNLSISKVHENLSKFEPFLVPGLVHEIELTTAKLPENLNPGSPDLIEVRNKMVSADSVSDGIIVNTFLELEKEYVKEYRKVKGCKIWCIGPLSACNKSSMEKAKRGSSSSSKSSLVDQQNDCLKWLDKQKGKSVIYASLGSICGLTATQLIELGLGLEASNKPFIWVIRNGERSKELEKWIKEERFEERVNGRGFLIRGWSPQLLILSHPSTGAFLTHCGWNSLLEGVCAGLPIITCPLFAEQFINEKFVVDVLRTGVSVGVKCAVAWGMEDKFGLIMKRNNVKNALENAMNTGEIGMERRRRALEIAGMAKRAVEEGGSSYRDVGILIQDIACGLDN